VKEERLGREEEIRKIHATTTTTTTAARRLHLHRRHPFISQFYTFVIEP
jgi:hypothetical protein